MSKSGDPIYADTDYAKIRFPSDKLSIADLRRLFPEDIDHNPRKPILRVGESDLTLVSLLYNERRIADIACGNGPHLYLSFGATPTAEDVERDVELQRQTSTEELVRLYQKFGLAKGPKSALQLIKGIEAAARSQSGRAAE